MTAPIQTIRLISQLALSATWDHLDDDATHPAQAARQVLELDADLARDLRVQRVVDASPDLDWTGRVALAIHLLLSTQQQPLAAAA